MGALVLLSRFGGLIRDALLASFLGAGWVSDAYITALRIPNMLRDLLGEGALSSVIVSRLGALKNEPKRIKTLIRQLIGFWGIILVAVAALGVLCAPILVQLIAHGFAESPSYHLAVELTRTIFPYIAIVGIAAMTMGILHHLKVFGWSTSSSSFSNAFMIAWLIAGHFRYEDDIVPLAKWIAVGVLISGFVQWSTQWPGLRGTGVSLLPSFKFKDPELLTIGKMLGPSILSVAAVQINVMVNHGFATSLGEGAASAVYFSFRLMQLPVGIVGVAVSTVLLPTLTDHLRENKPKAFNREMGHAIVGASFLSIPAIAGLAAIGPQVIAMLYERGAFDASDTQLVWLSLQGFLLGILPYVFNKSLVQAFFAKGDTTWPVYISMVSIVVNLVVNATLVYHFKLGVRGLTLGTSTVLFFNTLMFIAVLHARHRITLPWKSMSKNLIPMIILSLAMFALVLQVQKHLPPHPMMALISTAVGGAFYLGATFTFKKLFHWDMRKLKV